MRPPWSLPAWRADRPTPGSRPRSIPRLSIVCDLRAKGQTVTPWRFCASEQQGTPSRLDLKTSASRIRMRITRALAAAAVLVTAAPRVGTAQIGSSFKDAWFWGVKAGGMDFNSATTTHRQAPLGGIEWLITRRHGGLYVSYSEAFFTDQAAILTNTDPSDTLPRIINLKNMRRLDLAAMVFPGSNQWAHPSPGIGFS